MAQKINRDQAKTIIKAMIILVQARYCVVNKFTSDTVYDGGENVVWKISEGGKCVSLFEYLVDFLPANDMGDQFCVTQKGQEVELSWEE